jgi:hypothetical protein
VEAESKLNYKKGGGKYRKPLELHSIFSASFNDDISGVDGPYKSLVPCFEPESENGKKQENEKPVRNLALDMDGLKRNQTRHLEKFKSARERNNWREIHEDHFGMIQFMHLFYFIPVSFCLRFLKFSFAYYSSSLQF